MIVASNNNEGSPNSCAIAWHGGYSTLTLPDNTGRGYSPVSGPLDWERIWLPIDELDRGGSFITLTYRISPARSCGREFQASTGSDRRAEHIHRAAGEQSGRGIHSASAGEGEQQRISILRIPLCLRLELPIGMARNQAHSWH